LNKFYLRKPTLEEEQKRKIFHLASLENNKVLPLKLKLIVKYLNCNKVKNITKLLVYNETEFLYEKEINEIYSKIEIK
jgi:ligand-binding sensor domain-containing protein